MLNGTKKTEPTFEKSHTPRLSQNGEKRGTRKIQDRCVLKQVRFWIFRSDEADRRFGAAWLAAR
jgi:hypothetical protein